MKIAFDVDGTLINSHDEPRHEVIDLFRWFQKNIVTPLDLIIWSGGGIEYAQHWANKLGLKARIAKKFCEEVDIAIDDALDGEVPELNRKAKIIIRV